MTVADACKAAAAGPWSYPSTVALGGPGSNDDARAPLVGRWATCGKKGAFSTLSHAGIEFGANGRWRLLKTDSSGALVPVDPLVAGAMGRYHAFGSGQLDLVSEGVEPGQIAFVKFTADMHALRYGGGSMPGAPKGDYGRAQPSPLNGNDNPPSVSDGKCSMVGTWDVPANTAMPTAKAASIAFDAAGNFVGGPLGSDLCAAHTMYGTYRLAPGLFQLTSNVGMGGCYWAMGAGYAATFDETCTTVKLAREYDGCTGGRGYLNEPTTLTRRR
jgi:hypothetical protein